MTKRNVSLGNKLSKLKPVMIDEIWTKIVARLAEIFSTYELSRAGLSMVLIINFFRPDICSALSRVSIF